MAKQQRGRQGPQPHIKGFRPGKEPPHLRKQAARQQFRDLSAGQAKIVEMFADRTPEEGRRLIRRWRLGMLAATIVLAVLAAVLFTWSWIPGVIVGVLALVALFLWWGVRRQAADLEGIAETVGRGGKK